jgi:hypothetical protein
MRLLINAAAERVGLCPVELLALELTSVMPADPDTTVQSMSRILRDGEGCRKALKNCLKKNWLELLETGLLTVTYEGQQILSMSDKEEAATPIR